MIKMLNGSLLCEPVEKIKKNDKIFLPSQDYYEPLKVVETSDSEQVKVGDKIFIKKGSAYPVKIEDKGEFLVCNIREIIFIV